MADWIPRARGELTTAELRALSRANHEDLPALERELSAATGWPFVVLVPSARVGVVAALRALGAPAGSEVLVSALNFAPLVERIRARWAPIAVDVRGTSACPDRVAEAVTGRTGAIVATHAFGRPAPMAELRAIADAAGVPLIEDAAQALGARTDARGDAAVFSFGPTKPLAGWGGGAVGCDSATVAARIRASLPTRGERASRLVRGVAFEIASRFGGPLAKTGAVDAIVERWLVDPARATRRRPWQDAPMGAIEARLVRLRLAGLAARTLARRLDHAAVRARLAARGVQSWPDAPGGIGYGVLVSCDDAETRARELRHLGVDAPFGELRLVGDPDRCPRAAELERTLLRVPAAW